MFWTAKREARNKHLIINIFPALSRYINNCGSNLALV